MLYDLDAHSLRGHHFYKGIVDFRAKILSAQKHRILNKDQYQCVLCKGRDGRLFLEWEAGYQLFLCQNCSAVSPNILLEDKKLHIDDIYNTDDYMAKFIREVDKQFEYRKKHLGEERYNIIVEKSTLDPKKIKILDVGCGAGYFLSVLNDKNIAHKGLEMTPYLVDYCKQKGLNVAGNDLGAEPDDEYDVIVLFDVLEHICDPVSVFKTIHQKLRRKGYCMAFTPNIFSVGYELMGGKQNTMLPFEHLCFYNKESLSYLANQSNFRIDDIETRGLDMMDYLLMKEYEDSYPYTDKLKDMMQLVQAILDKKELSNHFRVTFRK